jgi:hypothetical protein
MHELDTLQTALDQLRLGEMRAQAFCAQARGHESLLQALPPPYRQVLDDLLDRLESSALFSGESCSFSQDGMLDNLQLWITKARAKLPAR